MYNALTNKTLILYHSNVIMGSVFKTSNLRIGTRNSCQIGSLFETSNCCSARSVLELVDITATLVQL